MLSICLGDVTKLRSFGIAFPMATETSNFDWISQTLTVTWRLDAGMRQMEKEDLEAYSETKMEIGFLVFMANSYAPQAWKLR